MNTGYAVQRWSAEMNLHKSLSRYVSAHRILLGDFAAIDK